MIRKQSRFALPLLAILLSACASGNVEQQNAISSTVTLPAETVTQTVEVTIQPTGTGQSASADDLVDRSDPVSVAAAYLDAMSAGNGPVACSFATDDQLERTLKMLGSYCRTSMDHDYAGVTYSFGSTRPVESSPEDYEIELIWEKYRWAEPGACDVLNVRNFGSAGWLVESITSGACWNN